MNFFPPPSPFPNAGRTVYLRQPQSIMQQQQHLPPRQGSPPPPQGSGEIDRRQVLPPPGCFMGLSAPMSPMLGGCCHPAVARQVSCISPNTRIDDLPIHTHVRRQKNAADPSHSPEVPSAGNSSSSSTVYTRGGGQQNSGSLGQNAIRLNSQNSASEPATSKAIVLADRKLPKEWSELPNDSDVLGLIDAKTEEEVGQRLESAMQLFGDLRAALQSHNHKCEETHATVLKEVGRFEALECRLLRCRQRTLHERSELGRIQQDLKKLQGEELDGVPPEEVEAIADKLATALSKATIRQAALEGSGPLGSAASLCKDNSDDRESDRSDNETGEGESGKEDEEIAKVYNPSDVAERTVELCDTLIEEITCIREKAKASNGCLRQSWTKLGQLRADKSRRAADLQLQKEEYTVVHKSLLAARRSKSLLIGEYDMQSTTPTELEEVCAAIVKATRKVHLALAMRQLQQQRNGSDVDPNSSSLGLRGGAVNDPLCIVCFENMWNTSLSPCGHVLCADCSSRLKYCPSCRHPIQARQRIYL